MEIIKTLKYLLITNTIHLYILTYYIIIIL